MSQRSVKIADVAKRAGVSNSTVSQVLNGKAKRMRVASNTEAKVYLAAKDLNYKKPQKSIKYDAFLKGELIAYSNHLLDSSLRIPDDNSFMFYDKDNNSNITSTTAVERYVIIRNIQNRNNEIKSTMEA